MEANLKLFIPGQMGFLPRRCGVAIGRHCQCSDTIGIFLSRPLIA
jgi:hypothetical protein